MDGEACAVAGLYGKIPALGDFVRRRLPRAFVEPWDGWLQAGLTESRDQLGPRWLNHYLTSPLWRFTLAAGLSGDGAVAGVLSPSVDGANRHFPLTIAIVLPPVHGPFRLAGLGTTWFEAGEDLALACLDPDLDPAGLETALDELGSPVPVSLPSAPVPPAPDGPGPLHVQLAESAAGNPPQAVWLDLLDGVVCASRGPVSLWWTAGSDDVAPCLRIYRGLPPAADFARFLADPSADRAAGPVPTAASQSDCMAPTWT